MKNFEFHVSFWIPPGENSLSPLEGGANRLGLGGIQVLPPRALPWGSWEPGFPPPLFLPGVLEEPPGHDHP